MPTPYWQMAERSFIEPARGGREPTTECCMKATKVSRLQLLHPLLAEGCTSPKSETNCCSCRQSCQPIAIQLTAMFLYKHATHRQFCADMHKVKLGAPYFVGWLVYSCCSHLEHSASAKRFVSLQFLKLRHSAGLLERVISPSQGRYLT
jgi:hypothetical protein